MTDAFVQRVGGISSADIAVPEHERVLRFYSRVLGTGTDPLWREDLLNNLGVPIIGLGARVEEYEHLPLQWMPHVQVADVARSAQRALERSGCELMHSKDEAGDSQWAVLVDPNGAAFGVIPVVSEADLPAEAGGASNAAAARMGRIAWLDLTIADAAATRDFYRHVVGWSVQDVAMEDAGERYADYNMLGADGQPAAGICHARGINAGLPPVWLIYLPVADLPLSLERARAEGGEIVHTVRAADGTHTCAVIRDPVGAFVGLVPEAPKSA